MMIYNTIYLRRAGKLILETEEVEEQLPTAYLATAMKNIAALGYTCSKPLLEAMRQLSKARFETIYAQLVNDLRVMVGAHVDYAPLYPGFPEQVMQADEAELYWQAIYHYATHTMWRPERADKRPAKERSNHDERPVEARAADKLSHPSESRRPKLIELGSMADFHILIRQMIEANGALSSADKKDLKAVLRLAAPEDIDALLPERIPFKENTGFVVAALLKYDKADMKRLAPYFKTASDVLRMAAAWSEGDVSLAEPCRYRSFRRRERRLLLGLLEQCGSLTEDMLRHRERWVRLGERLHPSEYKLRYPRCQEAFEHVRNHIPYAGFNHRVELAFQYGDVWRLIELLTERPGEFARRLDHLLRLREDEEYVVLAFAEIADRVATPLLLQVRQHFLHRHERPRLRIFFPKGVVSRAYAIPNRLPYIPETVCRGIAQACDQALIGRFAELPPLGRIYVDPRLRSYRVPLSQRSASKSLHTLVRGSRIPMDEGDTIRFFTWWREGVVAGKATGRVDIDLSAVMYDEHWNYVEHISYTHLRSAAYKSVHSGDIVSAPHGASEFIDLHLPSIVSYGGRYVVATLHSFTSHPYCDLPECFVGWMMRRKPGSGEIYEPSTVANKIDIAADTQIAIPVILDLVERTVIWADLALTRDPGHHNNVEGHQKGMVLMGQALTTSRGPDLYDLFLLHAAARGELVYTLSEADTIYAVDRGVTPYHTEEIMAEYLR